MSADTEKIVLTSSQLEAVSTDPLSDRIVIAMAGSGKTTVLTEYYMELLKKGLKPSEIIAVTFTNRAARSMKAKLNRKLNALNRADLAEEIHNAPITTIHSFLGDLVRDNALAIGLDPDWQVLDEMQADILMEETLKDLMNEWRESKADKYRTLITRLMWGYDPYTQFIRFWERLKSGGFDSSSLNPGKDMQSCMEDLKHAMIEGATDYINDLKNKNDLTDAEYRRLESLKKLHPMLKDFDILSFTPGKVDEIRVFLKANKIFGRVSNYFKPHNDYLQGKINEFLDTAGFIAGREVREALVELINDFDIEYSRAKRRENCLDFNDFEIYAQMLLKENPELLKRVKSTYKALLIDEFQDTNPVQMSIMNLIKPSPGFFAVGDPRQSIYGFRDADVGIMLQAIDEFNKDENKQVVELHSNYRSRGEILKFISELFHDLIIDRTYPDHRFGIFDTGRDFKTAKEEKAVEVIISSGDDIDKARSIEAEALANRLGELLNSGFQVEERDGTERNLRPKDCAILFRTRSNISRYSRELEKREIPHTIFSGEGFYNQREVMDLVNYLCLLNDPRNVQRMAEVVRAPFYGISSNSLLRLVTEIPSIKKGEDGIFTEKYWIDSNVDLSAEDKETYHDFQSDLEYLLEQTQGEGPSSRLRMILNRTHFSAIGMKGKSGKRQSGNILKLLDIADEWEESYPGDNIGFVNRMRELRFREVREEESRTVAMDDSVSLMTIHAAKGLEYPVVFLADALAKGRSVGSPWLLGKEGEIHTRHRSILDRCFDRFTDRFFDEESNAQKCLDSDETVRLLYVALSRAMEKLIICCPVKSTQATRKGEITEILSRAIDFESQAIQSFPDDTNVADIQIISGNTLSTAKSVIYKGQDDVDYSIDIAKSIERIDKWKRDFDRSNLTYTATEITSWLLCPRQYKCRSILGLREFEGDIATYDSRAIMDDEEESNEIVMARERGRDEFPATQRGTLIHNMLYEFLKNPDSFDMQNFIEKHPPVDFRIDVGNLQTIITYVKSHDRIKELTTSHKKMLEELIIFRIPGFDSAFKAMPDAAWVSNDKWHIFDFKTGSYHDESDDVGRAYAEQLRIYALAVNATFNMDIESAEIFYVDKQKIYPVSIDSRDLDTTKSNIRQFLDAVQKKKFDAQSNLFCGHCHYRNGCPEFAGKNRKASLELDTDADSQI